jgi:hypothetical protein
MNVADIKTAVRERDGHRCTGCGMTAEEHRARYGRTLDVHRTVPGSIYTLDGSVTLCRACHAPQPKRRGGQVDLALRGQPLTIRLAPDLAAAFRTLMKQTRRRVSAEVILALEKHLADHGLWQRPADPSQGSPR